MSAQAPRIDTRIVAGIRQLDDASLPIAETCRRAGALAERLGVVRPSYEQVRVLVHAERRATEERRAMLGELQDVYSGRRSPRALFDTD